MLNGILILSQPAVRPGLGAAEVAIVMRNLMHRIGYEKFYIQGGDWGSLICSYMATFFPKVKYFNKYLRFVMILTDIWKYPRYVV